MRLYHQVSDQLCAAYRRLMQAIGATLTDPEAQELSRRFWAQEQDCRFDIGCPDFADRPALVFGVEGLRALCGTDHRTALTLLRLAVAEIESTHLTPTDFADAFGAEPTVLHNV